MEFVELGGGDGGVVYGALYEGVGGESSLSFFTESLELPLIFFAVVPCPSPGLVERDPRRLEGSKTTCLS